MALKPQCGSHQRHPRRSQLQHMWRGADGIVCLRHLKAAPMVVPISAIESVGGKEIHDEATISCDIAKSIFALSIIAARI